MIFYIILALLIIYFIYILFKNKTKESFSSQKYTAIIIEPRKHKALEYVLNNFLTNLNNDWNIIIFHGNLNEIYVKNIIRRKLKNFKDRISLVNLKVDDLKDRYEYSKIFYDPKFYDNIPTETFLVFQTDSIICSKYKDLIYDFMEYDYVGAPWITNKRVGNGGLSLRKKSKMLELLKNCNNPNIKQVCEDLLFSQSLTFECEKVEALKIPNSEIAKHFAIETMYSDKAFGLHKAYGKNMDHAIRCWCPEIDKLRELNMD